MTSEEYISSRLENQIRWYSEKSGSAQALYKRWKVFECVLAASIPVISLIFWNASCTRYVVAAIGAVLSVLSSVHGLYKWHEHWIVYRSTAEALKREKFLYLAKAGPYAAPDADALLVSRCEQILSHENMSWAVMHEETKRKE